jgi:hypothetical protein
MRSMMSGVSGDERSSDEPKVVRVDEVLDVYCQTVNRKNGMFSPLPGIWPAYGIFHGLVLRRMFRR